MSGHAARLLGLVDAPKCLTGLLEKDKDNVMFAIPGKSPVTLTPAAVRQILRLMDREGASGLRVGVKKGGCAGMEYTMETAQDVKDHEEVVEQDGARVIIAPMAQMFLFGTEIDYETGLIESAFRFRNPNVTEACGCGESIKFDDIDTLTDRMNNARAGG